MHSVISTVSGSEWSFPAVPRPRCSGSVMLSTGGITTTVSTDLLLLSLYIVYQPRSSGGIPFYSGYTTTVSADLLLLSLYIVYRTRSWHLAISRFKRPRTAKPRPYGAPLRTRPGGVARERDGRLPGIGPSRKWGALKRLREGGYVREFARRARWQFAMRSAKAATRDGRLPGIRPARWPFARHPASEMAVCQASGQL